MSYGTFLFLAYGGAFCVGALIALGLAIIYTTIRGE